nr:putative capsid protein [Avon-Heathcote Estuary associated circular virus 11]
MVYKRRSPFKKLSSRPRKRARDTTKTARRARRTFRRYRRGYKARAARGRTNNTVANMFGLRATTKSVRLVHSITEGFALSLAAVSSVAVTAFTRTINNPLDPMYTAGSQYATGFKELAANYMYYEVQKACLDIWVRQSANYVTAASYPDLIIMAKLNNDWTWGDIQDLRVDQWAQLANIKVARLRFHPEMTGAKCHIRLWWHSKKNTKTDDNVAATTASPSTIQPVAVGAFSADNSTVASLPAMTISSRIRFWTKFSMLKPLDTDTLQDIMT